MAYKPKPIEGLKSLIDDGTEGLSGGITRETYELPKKELSKLTRDEILSDICELCLIQAVEAKVLEDVKAGEDYHGRAGDIMITELYSTFCDEEINELTEELKRRQSTD